MERGSMFGCGIGITKGVLRLFSCSVLRLRFSKHFIWYRQTGQARGMSHGKIVPDCHASVSGLHSGSALGDDESIDKKRPKISKAATIAPASITRLPPSADLIAIEGPAWNPVNWTPVRPSLKLVPAIAVVAFVALLAGSALKLSHESGPRIGTTVPSDPSELKGDLEKPSVARVRLFDGSSPAVAGDVVWPPDSGIASERLSQNSYFRGAEHLPFPLYQRPPPA